MLCDRCGKELCDDEASYTAVGIAICGTCNANSNSTISLDEALKKIAMQEERMIAVHTEANKIKQEAADLITKPNDQKVQVGANINTVPLEWQLLGDWDVLKKEYDTCSKTYPNFHAFCVMKLLHKPYADVTAEERQIVKSNMFAWMYSAGPRLLNVRQKAGGLATKPVDKEVQ